MRDARPGEGRVQLDGPRVSRHRRLHRNLLAPDRVIHGLGRYLLAGGVEDRDPEIREQVPLLARHRDVDLGACAPRGYAHGEALGRQPATTHLQPLLRADESHAGAELGARAARIRGLEAPPPSLHRGGEGDRSHGRPYVGGHTDKGWRRDVQLVRAGDEVLGADLQ